LGPEDEFPILRFFDNGFHNRRKSGDRAAAKVVAVSEASRQDYGIKLAQGVLLMPDIRNIASFDAPDCLVTILVAI
jgi:hypothetical protein